MASDLLCSERLLANLSFAGFDTAGVLSACASDSPVALPDGVNWDAGQAMGRPYMWAQQLAGLHCFPAEPSTEEAPAETTLPGGAAQRNHFGQLDAWLAAVHKRLADRINLVKEVS